MVSVQRLVLVFAGLSAWVGASREVHAQTEEELSVRRLALERAEAAQREGRHAEALELAERAGAIQMTPSVRFFIARELAEVGRRAEALLAAQTCVRDADRSPNLANREGILAGCRGIAEQALPRVGSVVLRLAPGVNTANVHISLNERPFNTHLLALPYYVDPGAVRVNATLEGHVPFATTVQVGERETLEVLLSFAPVVRDPPPLPRETSRPMVGPIALWAGGGAAVLSSAVLFGVRASFVAACPAGRERIGECPSQDALDAANRTPAMGAAAGVLLGVGVGALTGGVVWWVLSRSSTASEETSVSLVPTNNGAQLMIGGRL